MRDEVQSSFTNHHFIQPEMLHSIPGKQGMGSYTVQCDLTGSSIQGGHGFTSRSTHS